MLFHSQDERHLQTIPLQALRVVWVENSASVSSRAAGWASPANTTALSPLGLSRGRSAGGGGNLGSGSGSLGGGLGRGGSSLSRGGGGLCRCGGSLSSGGGLGRGGGNLASGGGSGGGAAKAGRIREGGAKLTELDVRVGD